MFKRFLILAVVAITSLPFTPSGAADQGPPYSRGRVCYHYSNGQINSYGSFCHSDPPVYGYVPSTYDVGAPFNIAASVARTQGTLVVGGKESLYLYPNNLALANVVNSAAIVDFSTGGTTTTVSATGDFEVIAKASSPSYSNLRVCLKVIDNGPISGYSPAPKGLLGSDCVNLGTSAARSLAKTVIAGSTRRISVEIEIDNLYNDGGGAIRVTRIGHIES